MIAIISDVHGNYPALKAVLAKLDELRCNEIISLGDVAGYYCMVNECIEEFRKRKIINLMGNHDSYLLGMSDCPRSVTVNNCIRYQRNIITKDNLKYLMNSPLTFDNEFISARHGGWDNPIDQYIYEFDFSNIYDNRIYCSGHSHIQNIQTKDGKIYFNPGSVGQPRDGNPKAAFAIIQDREVEMLRVDYIIDDIANRMKFEGFEDRITDCLYKGKRIKTYES